MRRLSMLLAAAVALPGVARAQIALTPTNTSWQVKCTALTPSASALNRPECDGTFKAAKIVNANPAGWATDPIGSAFYISPTSTGSLWSATPNENPNFQYTFRTTFDLTGYIASTAALSLPTFWFDNYWLGFALNGVFTPFSDIGHPSPGTNNDPYIAGDPKLPNGKNWDTNFQLTIPASSAGANFVSGVNTLDLVISGNGRTDAILASGFVTAQVVPEPSTYALMGAGLLALGVAARRRRVAVTR